MKFVDAKTLKTWIEKNEVTLIDVREPIEHEVESIKESILIPLSIVSHEKIPLKEDKKIVIYCKGGTRGGNACAKLTNLEAYNLEGGITAWKEAGFETLKSARKILPLDRQMQIIVGGGVLLFTLLGAFVNTKFLFLSGFFGSGLLFAGLTGFCALIKILALLPWNKTNIKSDNCSI
jgi:rhodanese-related sulfurtransferase